MDNSRDKETNKSIESKGKQLSKFAKFSGLGFQMAAVIGLGVYTGVWLDEKYPNKHKLYTIIFSLVFVCLSMFQAIRQLNKNNRK